MHDEITAQIILIAYNLREEWNCTFHIMNIIVRRFVSPCIKNLLIIYQIYFLWMKGLVVQKKSLYCRTTWRAKGHSRIVFTRVCANYSTFGRVSPDHPVFPSVTLYAATRGNGGCHKGLNRCLPPQQADCRRGISSYRSAAFTLASVPD